MCCLPEVSCDEALAFGATPFLHFARLFWNHTWCQENNNRCYTNTRELQQIIRKHHMRMHGKQKNTLDRTKVFSQVKKDGYCSTKILSVIILSLPHLSREFNVEKERLMGASLPEHVTREGPIAAQALLA